MNWASRSANNLFPLSAEKRDLASALREWLYLGDMYDLGAPCEACELCEHPDIRYQFKIVNRLNGNEMLVGSECINRFSISAADEFGNVLDENQSRRRVNRDRRYLVAEARRRRLINVLVTLSALDDEFDIDSFIGYVQDRGAFTPNQLALLFWRLNRNNVEYAPADFRLTIRRNREKDQLRAMKSWRIGRLWPALSPSQRNWVVENTEYRP